jgi:hypothetical protein
LSELLQEQQGWEIVGSAVDAGDVLAKIISLETGYLFTGLGFTWVAPC